MQNSETQEIFKIALIQYKSVQEKKKNLEIAQKLIAEAASKGAKLVALPAFFNASYDLSNLKENAEEIEPIDTSESLYDFETSPAPTCSSFLSTLARFLKIHIIGGSIFERDHDKFYETCLCFDDQGTLKLKYRKLHIIGPQEEQIVGGSQFGLFSTPFALFGIGLCQDIRFIEYPLILSQKLGANVLVFPSHFTSSTGPLQMANLGRSRAIDAQCFVAMISKAPSQTEPYGHSMVIDPWGEILEDAGEQEKAIICDIKLDKVAEVKESLRYATQKKKEVYTIKTPSLD